MAQQAKDKIVDQRHPEWSRLQGLWEKWRLTYEGGPDFIDQFLTRLSRRETMEDFRDRRALTYNENHAGSIVDIIRNAMSVRFPDVSRKGDSTYEELMRTDVDMSRSSMNTFMALEVVPLLLAQGKRFIGVDAPQIFDLKGEPLTVAEDDRRPYVWAIDAECVLSWTYDEDGKFRVLLMQEFFDKVDDKSGLIKGIDKRFRYLRRLLEGETDLTTGVTGPGVLVRVLDRDDKDLVQPNVLPISQIPIVELRLVDSLLRDVADMQIAHLNLSSSDMSFLQRGNFPIYVEQFDEHEAALKPIASEREVQSFEEEVSDVDRVVDLEDERERRRTGGPGHGIGYRQGLNVPSFIAPGTDNLRASMEKQAKLAQAMRSLVDLSLVSLSVKAVEQSGKSKEADRVGQEAALNYIAMELETGEREIAGLFHEFLGVRDTDIVVKYPDQFSIKTPEERNEELAELRKRRSSVQSKTYAMVHDQRIAEVAMKPIASTDEIEAAKQEIAATTFIDDDEQRQRIIEKDVQAGLVSKETASVLRGYEEGEADKVLAERGAEADMVSGGIVVPPEEDTVVEGAESGLEGEPSPPAPLLPPAPTPTPAPEPVEAVT